MGNHEDRSNVEMDLLKADLDETLAELNDARAEMNRLGSTFSEGYNAVLQLSQRLDDLILKYMQIERRYKPLLHLKKKSRLPNGKRLGAKNFGWSLRPSILTKTEDDEQ